MLSRKIAVILSALAVVGMLSACNHQPQDASIDIILFLTPSDWLLLGGALVLLFLVPVIIMYWPKRTLH
jgi:hypothetical protein